MAAILALAVGYSQRAASLHRGVDTLRGFRSITMSALDLASVRAVSFDVTGTILVHREPIMKTYADAAVWACLPDPPSEAELKPAFKQVF